MLTFNFKKVDDRAGELGYVAEHCQEESLVAGPVVQHREKDNSVAGSDTKDEDVLMVDKTGDAMDFDEESDAMTFVLTDRTRR